MKVVITGGTGQVGQLLKRHFEPDHKVIVIGRSKSADVIQWDGQSLGDWKREFENADVIFNLAGRSVNCRYTNENLKQMMDSRVNSTRLVAEAVAQCQRPPKLWLQMSTATIYSHRFDKANDDFDGEIGGSEKDAPKYWEFSVRIAKNWESELMATDTPNTRRVALRSSMIMSPNRGGIFDTLYGMVQCGLGGSIAGGRQFVSWIHEDDFCASVDSIIKNEDINGPIIIASPNPLPQSEFNKILRTAAGVPIGLPATKWMAKIGAVLLRTDTELIFKSRRVYPKKLLDSGYKFKYAQWENAAKDLINQRKKH